MFEPIRHFPMTGRLAPADASAVILQDPQGRYLLQDRDDMPGIFYPGHLGLFGGAREGDESWAECAVREIAEELGLDIAGRLETFLQLTLDFAPFGYGRVERVVFTCRLGEGEADGLRVAEGRRALLLDGREALTDWRVTPYDAFALWQHMNL